MHTHLDTYGVLREGPSLRCSNYLLRSTYATQVAHGCFLLLLLLLLGFGWLSYCTTTTTYSLLHTTVQKKEKKKNELKITKKKIRIRYLQYLSRE